MKEMTGSTTKTEKLTAHTQDFANIMVHGGM